MILFSLLMYFLKSVHFDCSQPPGGVQFFQRQLGGLFQVSHPYLTVLTTSPIRPQFADGSTPLRGLGRLSGHARGRGPVSPSLVLPRVPAECHARSVLPARSCRRLLPPDIWTPPHRQPECSEDTTDPKDFVIVQRLTLVYKCHQGNIPLF